MEFDCKKLIPLSIIQRVKPIQSLDDKNEMKFSYATKGIHLNLDKA